VLSRGGPSGVGERTEPTNLPFEGYVMRTEIEAIVDEIKQGMALLRRHL
jgi:hypothetical protein